MNNWMWLQASIDAARLYFKTARDAKTAWSTEHNRTIGLRYVNEARAYAALYYGRTIKQSVVPNAAH